MSKMASMWYFLNFLSSTTHSCIDEYCSQIGHTNFGTLPNLKKNFYSQAIVIKLLLFSNKFQVFSSIITKKVRRCQCTFTDKTINQNVQRPTLRHFELILHHSACKLINKSRVHKDHKLSHHHVHKNFIGEEHKRVWALQTTTF